MIQEKYFDCARENEMIFRSILKDIKSRVSICPKDLDSDKSLEEIFQKYSQGNRHGKFTILDFKKGPIERLENLTEDEALIDIENVTCLSGNGYSLKYKIKSDNSAEYVGCISNYMS